MSHPHALGVSSHWLISGAGPRRLDQDRTRKELHDALASELRHRICLYASDMPGYEDVELEYITIDAPALLTQFVQSVTKHFLENAGKAIDYATRETQDDNHAAVIKAIVDAVPYGRREDAREAAVALVGNAVAARSDRPEWESIRLSDAGIKALLSAHQFEGVDEAVNMLQSILEEMGSALT